MLTAVKALFAVPFAGSLSLLLSAVLAFVMVLVLLAYTISTIARTQMQAVPLTFFLPPSLLSGIVMSPCRACPDGRALGEIFPLTHFLGIVRAVMLKGADFRAIGAETGAPRIITFAYAALALPRFRRTLD